jgi:hypothetical protein
MADSIVYYGMLLNSISGVGIVILNKYIVTEDAFNYVVFISFCHYLFTMVFSGIMAKVGYITPTKIAIDKRVTLAMVRTVMGETSSCDYHHLHILLPFVILLNILLDRHLSARLSL